MDNLLKAPSWIELESVIPLEPKKEKPDRPKKEKHNAKDITVKDITNLSEDTVKRRYKKYVVELSDRRRGMKLRHALGIASGALRPNA